LAYTQTKFIAPLCPGPSPPPPASDSYSAAYEH